MTPPAVPIINLEQFPSEQSIAINFERTADWGGTIYVRRGGACVGSTTPDGGANKRGGSWELDFGFGSSG